MADEMSHILSGAVATVAIPSATIEEKIAVVAGTILPDLFFGVYFFVVSKTANKSIKDMTEEDYVLHGYSTKKTRFLKKVYFFLHGLPFLIFVLVIGSFHSIFLFLSLGIALHLLYDIFLHHYEDKRFRPRPLFPFSSKSFGYGITNSWRVAQKYKVYFWLAHILLIAILITALH